MNNIFIFEYLSNMKGKRKRKEKKSAYKEKKEHLQQALYSHFFLSKSCGDKIVIEMNPN